MKKTSIVIVATLLIVASLALCFAGCGDDNLATESIADIKASGELVVATSANFPPFEYKEGSEFVGWDMDIARYFAAKLGVELVVVDTDFDGVLSGVAAGKAHIGMAGISQNPTRDETLDFSDDVFDSSQMIIIRKGDARIQDAFDLEGMIVGAQSATVGYDLANMNESWAYELDENGNAILDKPILGKPQKANPYPTGAEAILNLISENVDAVILDKYPAETICAMYPDQVEILSEPIFEDKYAFAVAEGNTELAQWINDTIAEMKQNGEWGKITNKHFGSTDEE